MTTAAEVIESALTKLGAHSPLNPAPPETINVGVKVLREIIIEWDQQDFRIQAIPPTKTADELSEALGANVALEYELAKRMSAEIQKPMSDEVVQMREDVLRHARAMWRDTFPDRRNRASLRGRGNVNPWR